MKSGKRPTRKQKIAISGAGLNIENWLIEKNLPGKLHLVHRHTNSKKIINL